MKHQIVTLSSVVPNDEIQRLDSLERMIIYSIRREIDNYYINCYIEGQKAFRCIVGEEMVILHTRVKGFFTK